MNIKSISFFLLAALLWAGCKKGANPVDGNNAIVELKNDGSKKFVTDNISVNPKDSIFFSYTISSGVDMGFVSIQKNPVNQTAFVLRDTLLPNQSRTFSAIKGLQADSINGPTIYRIVAHTPLGVYIGHRDLIVTVDPDFYFWSFRILQVPDSVNKTNKSYYSTSDGKVYSYSEGGPVSANIDFGYYWDTTGRSTTATNDDLKHCLYSLSAPQGQLNYYDISSWNKNVTLLKKMPGSINFVTQLTSAGAIQTLIGNNMNSGTSTKVTNVTTAAGNNVIGFRTAKGKLGAVQIRFLRGDSPEKETAIEVDVKVQR